MDTDRITLTKATINEIRERLKEFQNISETTDILQLLRLVSVIGEADDRVVIWREAPSLPRGTRGYLVPNTFCNVNVKRTSIILAALVLDALVSSGLISAALHLGGWMEQGIAKIDPNSGEYCCLVHAIKTSEDAENLTPEIVHEMISKKACPFVELNCRLMEDSFCNAKTSDIEILFESLKSKGALEMNYGKWFVPL